MRARAAPRWIALAVALCVCAHAQDADEVPFEETPPPEIEINALPPDAAEPGVETDPRMAGIAAEMERQRAQTSDDTGAPPEFTTGRSGWRIMGQATVALCIVLGLILVVYYLLKRISGRTPLLAGVKLGNVMGRVALSPKAYLYFIKTGDRVLVVGWTPTSINRVAEFDAADFDVALKKAVPEPDTQPKPAFSATAPRPDAPFKRALAEETLRTAAQESIPSNEDTTPDDLVEGMDDLRDEIDRLRAYIRETTRETRG